jgi:hypothetical protein
MGVSGGSFQFKARASHLKHLVAILKRMLKPSLVDLRKSESILTPPRPQILLIRAKHAFFRPPF